MPSFERFMANMFCRKICVVFAFDVVIVVRDGDFDIADKEY